MVVAITYDKETGNVGQHFGHADFFKLYEIENGRIMDSAVVAPFGQGHEAVASTMDDYSVSLVICQNIGDGAMQALSAYGIAVCPNVEGLAAAVRCSGLFRMMMCFIVCSARNAAAKLKTKASLLLR